jgi:hypothetical protein
MKYLILLFIIVLISCKGYQNPKQEKPEQKKVLSPISSWLIQNEDTLFNFFKGSIDVSNKNENRGESDWTEYVFEGGIMGSLNERVHELASCIKIYYLYNPSQNPYFGILLTTDFDTSCSINIVDSLFSDIDSLDHFKIVKYRFPGSLFSGFVNEKDTLYPADISFKTLPAGEKFDVIMYSKRKYGYDTNELLKEHIFGEEVFLRKINSIKIQSPPDTTQNLKTIEEMRAFFKIKDRD